MTAGSASRWVALGVFGALALGYGVYQRALWNGAGAADRFGVWDLLLEVGRDPQFRAWVLIPGWLLVVVLTLRGSMQHPQLIRHGSYREFLSAAVRRFAVVLVVAGAVFVAAVLVAAVGLQLVSAPNSVETAAGSFREAGIAPLVGLALQGAVTIVTLLAIAVLLTAVRAATGSLLASAVVAVAVWLWAVLSSAGVVDPRWAWSAGYYFDPLAARESPAESVIAAVVVLVVAAGSVLAVVDTDRRSRGSGIRWRSPWTLYWAVAAGVVWLSLASSGGGDVGAFDAIGAALYGSGGTITQFLAAVVLYLGFAFVFAVELSEQRSQWGLLQLLRHGTTGRWALWVVLRAGGRSVLGVLGLAVLCVVGYILVGGRDFAAPAWGVPPWLYQFAVNGWLQLFWYAGVAFAATLLVPARVAGYVSLAALMMVAAVLPGPLALNPVGASGMSRASLGWEPVLTGSLVIAVALIVTAPIIVVGSRLNQPGRWT